MTDYIYFGPDRYPQPRLTELRIRIAHGRQPGEYERVHGEFNQALKVGDWERAERLREKLRELREVETY